jgi:hypothetical protein
VEPKRCKRDNIFEKPIRDSRNSMMKKFIVLLIGILFLGWFAQNSEADSDSRPGVRFHERLPMKKKEEIRIVDDFTVEVSLGSDNKWVSSNINDALRSIPTVSSERLPSEVRFRERKIFLQKGRGYTWDQEGKEPVKLTSGEIRERGNILIRVPVAGEKPSQLESRASNTKASLQNKEREPSRQDKSVEENIDGFRSAKFGMTQQEVLSAILKDFGIGSDSVKRGENPSEKTDHLIARVIDLLPGSGQAMVVYMFGYQSQKLYQINLFWGKPFDPEPNPSVLLKIARSLNTYFSKRGFVESTVQQNVPLTKELLLVFKGADGEGRMVEMILSNVNASSDQKRKSDISLRLSYIEDPSNPDIYKIQPEDF